MSDYNEIKRVSKIYDDRASRLNSIDAAGQWGSKELSEKITEEILKKIELDKNDIVLEIGCGSGVLGNIISKKSQMFVGFDVSNLMLKKFQNEHIGINIIQASATHIPLRNDYFDKVVLNSVSMYFSNEEFFKNVITEIKMVCKNKALIFIGENIVPSKYCWELVWFQDLPFLFQILAKPYIKFRRWVAGKNPYLAGKWKYMHKDVSPKIIKKIFKNFESITISDSASYTIRKKIFGKNTKGNKRMDFLIKIND